MPQQNGQGQATQSGEIPGQAAKQYMYVYTLRKDGRERLGRSSRKIGEHGLKPKPIQKNRRGFRVGIGCGVTSKGLGQAFSCFCLHENPGLRLNQWLEISTKKKKERKGKKREEKKRKEKKEEKERKKKKKKERKNNHQDNR